MRRRQFLMWSGIAAAGSVVGACAPRADLRHGTGGSKAEQGNAGRALTAADFHATRRLAETRFGRIAYVERGSGEAALFVHAYLLSGFQWRGVLGPLSAHRRCIALDLMGLGYTEVAEGQSVAPDAQVEMMAAFLDALSIDRVDLVASDSGGQAAQLFLVRHPDRVRSLLLTNCDTEPDSPPAALKETLERAHAGTLADLQLLPQLRDKAQARLDSRIVYADPRHPTDEAIDYNFAPLVSSPRRKALLDAYTIGLERNPMIGIAADLRRSRVPARIVWGLDDTIFSSASPDYLDRTLGGSRGVRRLAGEKLLFPEERPDVIVEEAAKLWGAAG
ncbi:alpha/beta fold hydrolase [Luteimonas aquatica]|uniref:alpha/beta fold hydrolase n=1 Tax=Luteimonas aquatica TaxID=450364 RepID=UPI001F590858|nr:alpha/beta hydrolase [Luteimonas aquatica]